MYSLILRKGKIELQLNTTDKDLVTKHIGLIINQASNRVASVVKEETLNPESVNEEYMSENNIQEQVNEVVEVPQQNIIENVVNEPPILNEDSYEQYEEVKIEPKETEIIPENIQVTTYKPNTINAIQNPVQEEEKQPNFDMILNNEMNNETAEVVLKDSKFIEYVESKSAIEKLDFLVIAAQYLAQFENMNTFNLKHINAKLMQNFTIIVDHSVLQSAISKEYITKIHEGFEDGAEYMLTEKGLRSY